jgi:hypothetical protein
MVTRKKNLDFFLDLPYELELLADDIEYSLMLVNNQSPISSSSLGKEELGKEEN